jgi:hypothetical protein
MEQTLLSNFVVYCLYFDAQSWHGRYSFVVLIETNKNDDHDIFILLMWPYSSNLYDLIFIIAGESSQLLQWHDQGAICQYAEIHTGPEF